MNPEQTRSILSIALLAAFADRSKDDREREAIKRVAEALGEGGSLGFYSFSPRTPLRPIG